MDLRFENGSKEPAPDPWEDAAWYGAIVVDAWLAKARDPKNAPFYGHSIMRKLETLASDLPAHYESLDFRRKTFFLQKNSERLFPAAVLARFAEAKRSGALGEERTLDAATLAALFAEHPETAEKRPGLARFSQRLDPRARIHFRLFDDGSEILTIGMEKHAGILRFHRWKTVPPDLREREASLPEDVPAARFYDLGDGHIASVSEKIQGRRPTAHDKQAVLETAARLAEREGFLPDVNAGNFLIDSTGKVFYVDGDYLDHHLSPEQVFARDHPTMGLAARLRNYEESSA